MYVASFFQLTFYWLVFFLVRTHNVNSIRKTCLQVPMNYMSLVTVLHGTQNLCELPPCLFFRKSTIGQIIYKGKFSKLITYSTRGLNSDTTVQRKLKQHSIQRLQCMVLFSSLFRTRFTAGVSVTPGISVIHLALVPLCLV